MTIDDSTTRRPADRLGRLVAGRWSTWRALACAVLATVMLLASIPQMITSLYSGTVLSALGVSADSVAYGPGSALVEKTTMLVCGVLVMLLLARPASRRSFGLGGRPWVRTVLIGLAGVVVLNLVLLAFTALTKTPADSGDFLKQLGIGHDPGVEIVTILAIGVIAPVAEEYLFRALLYKGLRDGAMRWLPRGASIALAAALSSLVFMEIHRDPSQTALAPVYIVFGLLCALAYEFTGSLVAPIVLHSANNCWALMEAGFFRGGPRFSAAWVYVVCFGGFLIALGINWLVGAVLNAAGGDRQPAASPAT